MSALAPTRRGLLGLFAAAVPAVALTAPAAASIARQSDWRTKDPNDWTKAKYLAEAEYQIASSKQRIIALRAAPTHPDNVRSQTMAEFSLEWWERERSIIARGC